MYYLVITITFYIERFKFVEEANQSIIYSIYGKSQQMSRFAAMTNLSLSLCDSIKTESKEAIEVKRSERRSRWDINDN